VLLCVLHILTKKLYVSIAPFECDVKSNSLKDLRVMGQVAKFEYDCFAEYVKEHKKLPKFNDKKIQKNTA